MCVLGVQPSRLPGAEGNQEFFLHAILGGERDSPSTKR
jgi:predicted rRNA methylase YqxC with S4 and FtsJ domains